MRYGISIGLYRSDSLKALDFSAFPVVLLLNFIEEQDERAEYSEPLVRKPVSKNTICDGKVTIKFKTGLSIGAVV